MLKFRSILSLVSILIILCSTASGQGGGGGSRNRTTPWQTLNGDAPLVVARGGFSGLLPDSSLLAYQLAVQTGLPNLIVWCDVQLTRDGVGVCISDFRLDNATSIATVYNNRQNTYDVDGVQTTGWFSIDFTLDELAPVFCKFGYFPPDSRLAHPCAFYGK